MGKKGKKWLIWSGVVVLIGIAGIWYLKSRPAKVTYTTAPVTQGTLTQTVSVTGTLNPSEQIDMSFKTSGILKSIAVDVGDTVTQGERLATLDTGSLLSQLREAQAAITYQKETLDNMRRHSSTFTSDDRLAQEAQVAQAQAAADAIVDQLGDVNLVSPITGIVIKRNADPGETMVLNLNSPVLTVAPKDDLLIESNVPESDITKVQLGQKATVTFDALDASDTFTATVYSIDPASTVIEDVVYYRIKLKLDTLDARLKPGMSANIDLHTAQEDNVLSIPFRAVQDEASGSFVDVLRADGTLSHVKVTTGLEGDDGLVEITSGLTAGQQVVTFTNSQ